MIVDFESFLYNIFWPTHQRPKATWFPPIHLPESAGINFEMMRAAGEVVTFITARVGSSNNVWSEYTRAMLIGRSRTSNLQKNHIYNKTRMTKIDQFEADYEFHLLTLLILIC